MNDDQTMDARETGTLEELIRKHVRTPEQQRRFLQRRWTNDIVLQLIQLRSEAGLSQREIGERMGKQQSAIARLESNNDIKLSTLFDYLAALGLTPAGEIPVKPYAEALERFAGNDAESEESSSSLNGAVPVELAAG